MSSFLCRSNKPLQSIKYNAEVLLSFSVINFKNAVVQDFGYIVSSALLLTGNLSGLQTNLTAGGDRSYGSVQNHLSTSLFPQGKHGTSAPALLHATVWKRCFCMEAVQLVNTTALPDCNQSPEEPWSCLCSELQELKCWKAGEIPLHKR